MRPVLTCGRAKPEQARPASAGAMQPLCHQRTTGEETLACLHEIRVSGTRVHAPGRHDAAAPRAAMLRQRVRSLGRCVVVACLAVIGAVHAASNVVQYTHDAAGNIVAIRRVNPSPITIAGFAPLSGPTGTVVTITGTGFGATPTDQRGHVQWRGRNGRCGNGHHAHRCGAGGRRHGQDRGNGRRQHRDQRPGFRRRRAGRPDDHRIHAGGGPARHGSDRHRNEFQRRAGRHDGQAESECRDRIVGHDDAARVRRSGRHRLRQDPHRDKCGQRRQRRGFRRAARVDRRERHHRHDQACPRTGRSKASASLRPASMGPSCSTATRATGSASSFAISRSIRRARRLRTRSTSRTTRSSRAASCRPRVSRSICRRCPLPAPTRCCSPRASRRFRSTRGSRATSSSPPTGRHWPSRGVPGNPRAR